MKRYVLPIAAASLTVPMLLTGTALAHTLDSLIADGSITDVTLPDNEAIDYLDGKVPADALTLLTSGTGAKYGQLPTWAHSLVGKRETLLANYPGSWGPLTPNSLPTGGLGRYIPLFAPSYSDSVAHGVGVNLDTVEAIRDDPRYDDRVVVFVGFSQGAETAADAFEEAIKQDLIPPGSSALILSDPRSPWGLKAWAKDDMGIAGALITRLIGVENNGARDPEAITDAYTMTQVVVSGDSIAHMTWDPKRPLTSAGVAVAGYFMLHGGRNPWSTVNLTDRTAENTEGLDDVVVFVSANGNVRYEVYDSYHPTAILQATIEQFLFGYTEEEFVDRVQELEPRHQAWFAVDAPSIEDAHVELQPTPEVEPLPSGGYEVTVPAEVATGGSTVIPVEEPVTETVPVVAEIEEPADEPVEETTDAPEETPADTTDEPADEADDTSSDSTESSDESTEDAA
ncbi:hypothetical protein SEA_SKOG_134 [Gordonia phage Skog]|uniref:Uncharacterized protein n=1 Tax=Gordonia phage Skog TaxID=2704033 RepID=A0A6G6XJT3_9CAUD|nr:portal protein [Gordonia phage Skog]QIG58286.1 hypothetical protein SEA_SKOG_134 [Gordonia phage Skog]